MFLQDYIQQQKDQFQNLCETYHVRSMYAFGSAVTPQFNPEKSDIDVFVDIDENDPVKKGTYLFELWNQLEAFFRRKVDLLTPSSVRNPVLKENIERSKVLIYER